MKKTLLILGAIALTACGSDEDKENKERVNVSACDCAEISTQMAKMANEGMKYGEIEKEIGKGKLDVCKKMYRDKDYPEKLKECR